MNEMRIGELAAATGLSVRAVRHYEKLGLVVPAVRSRAGHRLYGPEQLERLACVCALKNLGLSLSEIGAALEREPLSDLLERQLQLVEGQIQELTRLEQRLRRVSTYARAGLSGSQLAELIRGLVQMESYFTAEQLEQLRQRREARGSRESRWRALGDALRACMEAGKAPTDAEVRALAARRREMVIEFCGGDEKLLEALKRLPREQMPPRERMAGWDAELMAYADRAWEQG